jgi:Na+-translocating ferredoxin:NAD+ oxidoreductase subunit B
VTIVEASGHPPVWFACSCLIGLDVTHELVRAPLMNDDSAAVGGTRQSRYDQRVRNPKWKNPALKIDMSICINCDTCLRHCPPHFGAIFNHGIDVIIVPELCSGCGKCLPPICPVDCIIPDPTPDPTPDDWWQYAFTSEDPYA